MSRIVTMAECAPRLGSVVIMNEILIPKARLYASRRQLELAEPLGSGKDGIVLVARRNTKPADVAIKVHSFAELYEREKRAYERLGAMNITSVLGFSVPRMIGCDDDLQAIEMTIVDRPFILDFAAAYLDARPEFPADVWADWETEKREQFEQRWPRVQEVLNAFAELGIYLMDVSPANIAFLPF
jgi:hypothetical protein